MSKAISEDQRFCFSITVVIQSLSHVWLCDPLDDSMPGFPVLHHFLELAQSHVHGVSDAIQPSCPLSPPSLPAFNLSQHQGLFQWVSSSYQVAKILVLQLQHQSFQWIFRVDFLLLCYGYLNFQRFVLWDPIYKGVDYLVCIHREFCILYFSLYPCFLVQLTLWIMWGLGDPQGVGDSWINL